ncbi:MAG TPA: condensation domain-containing protein, partial [Micromonosporaceae bacterium]|nr:condensation domain-containing protein [Micromonosporaceae bacterium]
MTDPSHDTHIPRRPADLVELPLSPQQRRWWFLCTSYRGALSPIVSLVHRLRGPLVVDAWLRAVGALVDRHEGLRVRFVNRPDGPVQVIAPPAGLDVERIDLTGLPEEVREDRARQLLNERRQTVLDLAGSPLVTSCLIRLADDDHVWTLTAHHILADGAAMAIADRELRTMYRACADGTEPELPDIAVPFGDYAVWQDSTPASQYADDRSYWLDRLAGVPPLDLRTDRPRPAVKSAPAAEVGHPIPGELAQRVEELARSERCTRFMALLAAFQVLLAEWSGQRDICVGLPVMGAGRARA